MKGAKFASAVLAALVAGAGFARAGAPSLTTDPGIPAPVLESWGRQADFFRSKPFEIVSWEEAQKILLSRECRGGKQYHTGWVTIYTKDGGRYLVKPPAIDNLFSFFKRHGMKGEGFAPE